MAAGNTVSFEELDSATLPGNDAKSSDKSVEKPDSDAAAAAAKVKADAEGKEKETREFMDKEATETLEKLADLGITPDSAEGVATKAQAFDNVLNLLQNNPRTFLNELEKFNPKGFNALLDQAADRYLELHPPSSAAGEGGSGGAGAGSAGSSRGANDPVMAELTALRQRLDEKDARDQENDHRQRLSSIKSQYETKVTSLIDKLTELKPRDRKAVRALVNDSVSNDPKAIAEINRGQFTSVAKHLQTVMTDWTADTTNASADEHAKREGVKNAGSRADAATAAAGQSGGERAQGTDDWDDVAESFAKAMVKR